MDSVFNAARRAQCSRVVWVVVVCRMLHEGTGICFNMVGGIGQQRHQQYWNEETSNLLYLT